MIDAIEERLKFAKKVGKVETVFDIACGFGMLSKYFLDQGCMVKALDLSVPDIKECEKFKFLEQNILDYEFKDKFDLNICSLLLHFFNTEDAKNLITNIKKTTADNGYNLIVCMSDKDSLHSSYPNNFYISREELIELYSDWELVSFLQDDDKVENHDNLGDHSHNLIFALFKKSGEV